MFCDFDRDFMSKKMKIVVESIEEKLNEPFFAGFKEIAIDSISTYTRKIIAFEGSGLRRQLNFAQDNEAEEFINVHFCEITHGMEEKEEYQVLDALRHSFSCYAYNGLHQLYTRQENESWHPKIWLTEVLEPNDIESLPKNLTLYRGCDISELENKSFGQAWSTSLKVAKLFAHTHYQNQEWFVADNRVVLEANFSKDDVLFSDQSIEFELVVIVEKLHSVHKHI